MKLFMFAALIAAASAARLEHLERAYLPPHNNGQNGNGFGSGSNGFGVSGHGSNRFGLNGASNGFGSNGQGSVGSNGQSGSLGSNGFLALQGSNSNGLSRNAAFEGATSNQYLPPDQGSSGSESESNGFGNSASTIKPSCLSCGAYNQYNQAAQGQVPSSNYGVPQLGSRSGSVGSNGLESESPSVGSNGNGSPSGSQGSQPQFGAASRQYLAPKYSSSQNPPQQPFDENTGYIY